MHHRYIHSMRHGVVVALLTAIGLLALAPAASAAPAGKGAICHATGSATNPYVQITISENALEAHRAHQDGEDIIPAPAAGCPGGVVVPPPSDVCPNLEGDQAEVPAGYEQDAGGNCVPIVPPPSDVCPNLEGDQAEVPAGFEQDADGNCVPVQEPFIPCIVSVGVEQTATTVIGTPADDTIDCSAASPGKTIDGLAGNDTITATQFDDVVTGGEGNDTITGLGGDDILHGGTGNDTISGGEGNDTITGGEGNDTLSGEGGNDFVDGGDDDDVLSGGTGVNQLIGGNGTDTCDGGPCTV